MKSTPGAAGKHENAAQIARLKREVRAKRPTSTVGPAASAPIARVAVDLPLAHLDRPFDYLVPSTLHEETVAGCRVKVRFAGRDVGGFVLSRVDQTDHGGALTPLRRVVSSEPVLSSMVAETARHVADRYAGTFADVLRLAVPPRHARVEAEEARPRSGIAEPTLHELASMWPHEASAPALLSRLAAAEHPRAVWTATPGADWPAQLASAAAATLMSGRGSILCVPDARDVARLELALTGLLGTGSFVVLTADVGPAARYRAFLALSRGLVQIVVGTRSAAFAPVHRLGLVAMWDDGDDLYAEPRAPYPHAREVLLLRAHHEQTAVLLGAMGRSTEAQSLVESGWAVSLAAPRDTARVLAPQVHVTGESDRDLERDAAARAARMPRHVFEVVREALRTGPVLVNSPRYGYQPVLACARCREPARCQRCTGPLSRSGGSADPRCRWCGLVAEGWRCAQCGGQAMRAPVVGSLRTAEEWGRSFPQTSVISSGGDHVIDAIDATHAIVIATTGAEPRAAGRYAAAVLLDTWLTLSRPDFRAGEEAVRRWLNVCALVRPGSEGGRVIAVGEPTTQALQALVRWDPEGFAARELASRRSAQLTPAATLATVLGQADVITEALAALDLPRYVEVLGPVDVGDGQVRLVLRTSRARGAGLAKALIRLQSGRSSRKLSTLRVQIDPAELV